MEKENKKKNRMIWINCCWINHNYLWVNLKEKNPNTKSISPSFSIQCHITATYAYKSWTISYLLNLFKSKFFYEHIIKKAQSFEIGRISEKSRRIYDICNVWMDDTYTENKKNVFFGKTEYRRVCACACVETGE